MFVTKLQEVLASKKSLSDTIKHILPNKIMTPVFSKIQALIARPPERGSGFMADPLNSISIGFAGLLNIIHWLLLIIKIKPGNSHILLHYNIVYGPDFVDKSSYVYLIPFAALIIFIMNIYISTVFFKKEKLAAYFLNIASIAVQVIFLVAGIVLIISNGT